MRSTRHYFTSSQGVKLSARLDLPADGKPAAYALFAHCFTGSKNWNAVKNIARALTQEDIAVFRFDFAGLGESEGDFADTNFSSNVGDIVAAAKYMIENGMSPQLLIGHSLGGAATIIASPQIPSLRAAVTIGSPSDPAHVQHLFEASMSEIKTKGEAQVMLGGRKFVIREQFVEDLEQHDLPEILSHLNRALLVLHSPQDKTVGIENAAKLFKGAKHPKSFVTLDGADHLLTQKEDSLYAGNLIASWAARYIIRAEDSAPFSEMRVAAQTESDFFTDIKAGQFHLSADRPKRMGGNEMAPSPYDLLMSSLASSTSMTIRYGANDMSKEVSNIKVHLEPKKTGGKSEKPQLLTIKRIIELKGNLTEQEIQVMASRCPVYRIVKKGLRIETEIVLK